MPDLVVGIGGGGDVAGALAVGRCLKPGEPFELGGVAWERWSVDPHPGPRRLEELAGIERIGETRAALCGPDGRTPEGTRLCEAGAAEHLGRQTVLVDVTAGPAAAAEGMAAACERLGCNRIVLADVGGDVLATGEEPGLASPLCDAVMLAAATHMPDSIEVLGCAFGSGCDGELTVAEVLARIAALAREGIWTGTLSPTPEAAREVLSMRDLVPTEASLMAARSALGELGPAKIRGGRRTVQLGPVPALAFLFDARAAVGKAAPLAAAVLDAPTIEAGRDRLAELGIRTELDYELDKAAQAG